VNFCPRNSTVGKLLKPEEVDGLSKIAKQNAQLAAAVLDLPPHYSTQ
jgi:hypothetical protein